MKMRVVGCWLMVVGWAACIGTALAATGESAEFRVDLRGLGPWQNRVAAANETIVYSPAWATNGGANAQAVVKVAKARKTKPKYIAIDLSGGTTAKHYPVEYLDEIPGGSWSDTYKTSKLVLRHIPAGSFIMGGRNTDYPGAVNTNLHMVTITKDFYLGVFEVTQRQWELVMGTRPSKFTNTTYYATRPVENMRYLDIRGGNKGLDWPNSLSVDHDSFLGVFRSKTGLNGFDLPTEAQWEYACRAGTTTALYTGKNLSAKNAFDSALAEIARYTFDGGGVWSNKNFNVSIVEGTTKVGSYQPNEWGLYDMFGNVWEMVINRDFDNGGIDPVGPNSSPYRMLCGGSWVNPPSRCLEHPLDGDCGIDRKNAHIGLRLCLQGGEIPEVADEATEFVVSAAAGMKTWTPTEAGTYLWTHEVTNANGVVKLESARFVVGGPILTLEPQGDLEKGVGVAVNGAWDGWQVYYTLDGSAPTTNSTAYVDAITMNDSSTIRAIAYNAETGVYSEAVSGTFLLYDALGVVSAVAKPRYPWNGKVDVDFELNGDSEQRYLVELVATDMAGGTNLPVRTVYMGGPRSVAAGDGAGEADAQERVPPTLGPGKYRAVWDADADIAHDFDFGRVAVTVKATSTPLADYARRMELTVNGYTGTEVLTNVPTLVRLSTAIAGFDYNDFASPTNGADLAFFTPEGKVLPYEIDEWNTNGESLVWVKLPELKQGTTFTAAWGCSAARGFAALPSQLQTSNLKHQTWSDYAGVWHMNEDSGTAFDSTEHHLDGIPGPGNITSGDPSASVVHESGACGRSRYSGKSIMEVPSYDALRLGGDFVASTWCWTAQMPDASVYPKIFFRKSGMYTGDGWGAEFYRDNSNLISIVGGGDSTNLWRKTVADIKTKWVNLVFVYSATRCSCYVNGTLTHQGTVGQVTDNGRMLRISDCELCSDEIRLIGGTLSADRIKADCDMIANRNFLEYGTVKAIECLPPKLGGVQLWENGPYWAECNVGASRPEEYGYYFWWGDTVGYRRNSSNDGWVSAATGTSFSFSEDNCPTFYKSYSELMSQGYIDSSGNLVPAHDAATAHLGDPWRMPTYAEWGALIDNCDAEWTTRNGVYGLLATGRGAYSLNSIFLPAAGDSGWSGSSDSDSWGMYWSSSPCSGDSYRAWYLHYGYIYSDNYFLYDRLANNRYYSLPVRPVRGSAK